MEKLFAIFIINTLLVIGIWSLVIIGPTNADRLADSSGNVLYTNPGSGGGGSVEK